MRGAILPLLLVLLLVSECSGGTYEWFLLGIDPTNQTAVIRNVIKEVKSKYTTTTISKKKHPIEIYLQESDTDHSELVYQGSHAGWGRGEQLQGLNILSDKVSSRYAFNPHFLIKSNCRGDLIIVLDTTNGTVMTLSTQIPDPRDRSFSPLQSGPVPELSTIQEIGDPGRQNNIVFLSSGYLPIDKEKFKLDVTNAVSVLQFGTPSLDSSPWPRFFSSLNVYSVFQPSSESGASMPHGKNHVPPSSLYCDDEKGCEPFFAKNNLDCAYGTPHQKMLYCNYEKVVALASYSPNPTVIVVIVNHNVYGGTGDPGPSGGSSPGVAVVYNGESLALLLVHELGHAFAGLSDEYSYGIEESSDLGLKNCAFDPNSQWNEFRDDGFDVDQIYSKPCSYSNYYKPTSERCLMGRSYSSMCSICKHEMSLAFYDTEPDMGSPRCPLPGEIIYLTQEDEITLRINPDFSNLVDVKTTWVVPGNYTYTTAELSSSLLVLRGSSLNPGRYEIVVTVVDDSVLVLPSKRLPAMNVRVVFTIARVTLQSDKPHSCSIKKCQGVGWEDKPYCSVCDPSKGVCNITHVIHPKQYEGSSKIDIDRAAAWIWTTGGIVLISAVVITTIAYSIIVRHRKTVVQVVVILPQSMQRLRLAVLIEIIIAVISSIITLCIAIYAYDRVLIFGKGFLLAVLLLALFLFCSSFPLLVAVFLRHVKWMIISTVWLCVIAISFLCVGSLILWVANNIGGETLRNRMSRSWDEATENNPQDVCRFQRHAKCSGFIHSCSNVGGTKLPSYCPINCEIGNRVADSCYSQLEDFVSDNFKPAGTALIVCFVYLLIIMVSSIVLAIAVQSRKNEMIKRRRYRLLGVTEPTLDSDEEDVDMTSPPLTDEEITQLKIEFQKVDKNKNNTLDRQEAFTFWEVALGHPPTEYDIETAEKFVDTNCDGLISFEEFIALYQPFDHRHSTEDSRTNELDNENPTCIDPQIRGELTPADIRFLRSEFKRIDRGCGILSSKRQLKEWYRILYGRDPMDDEIEWFSNTVDPENTGKVDFQGFCLPYKNQRKQIANQLLAEVGTVELRKLRRLFGEVNKGNDSVLTTDEEFSLVFEVFHGRSPPSQEDVEELKQLLALLNNGIVGFLEFCTPFARRARRRKKMRQGLDPERIEAIRSHYLLLEKDELGNLAAQACSQLYSVLYEEVPSEEVLCEFIRELDVEKVGAIGFDEILRLFAETARMTSAKRWLQGQGVTATETVMVENDFKVLSTIDDGLRMGVPLEGVSALLRNTSRSIGSGQLSTAEIRSLFTAADHDGDGFLDELEFTQLHFNSVLSVWKDAGVPLPVPMTIRTDLLSQPSQLTLPNPLQESPSLNPLVNSLPQTPVLPSHPMQCA